MLIEQIKRSGRGFRNLANYRLRILLAGGRRQHRRERRRKDGEAGSSACLPVLENRYEDAPESERNR